MPQVLLRGFAYNKWKRKSEAKVKVLKKQETLDDFIVNVFQENEFYSRETESTLDREHEQPFGLIKKRIEIELLKEKATVFPMIREEYLKIIRFFVVMWRRNNYHIDNTLHFVRSIYDDPLMRSKMQPQYQNIASEDLIDSIKTELQHDVYQKTIMETTDTDPTVQKQYRYYISKLVVNETNMSFPLHSKHSTVIQWANDSEEYPRLVLEPITNHIFMVFIKQNHEREESENVDIEVIYLTDIRDIEALITLYLIPSVTAVVYDDSNYEFVCEIMSHIDDKRKVTGNVKTKTLLDKLGINK